MSTTIHPTESIATRLINAATPKEREKFLYEVHRHYESQNLYNRLIKLWETTKQEWTKECESEYNACDEQHIIGMISVERKTCREKLFAWSPTFGKAIETKAFWKIILSIQRNHTWPAERIKLWAQDSYGIEDIRAIPISEINSRLREAQKELRDIKRKAAELRESHLKDLLTTAQDTGNKKQQEKRLRILIRAHKKQYAYKKLQFILKPNNRGGLSSVLVPEGINPTDYPYDVKTAKSWTQIYDHNKLQKFVQHRNMSHFGQVHNTPFTIPPLDSLDWGAQDDAAEQLLAGNIPNNLKTDNKYVMEVLKYIAQRKQLPEIDTYLSPDEVARGFKKWRESTSTSPSGCHLGLRRIPAIMMDSKELDNIRSRVQSIQAQIMNIPIQIGFSPRRWQTVINAMLEKIPGKPFLHKLR
jgi:hypothetical protein